MFGERPCPLTEHSYRPYAGTISFQRRWLLFVAILKFNATAIAVFGFVTWSFEYKVPDIRCYIAPSQELNYNGDLDCLGTSIGL